MHFTFKTIHEFNDFFKDEVSCYRFLESQFWVNGTPVCPHCGCTKFYAVKSRSKQMQDMPTYRCADRACLLHYSIRTNTVFEGSKIGLRNWFQAIYELSTSKKGISSVELAARIGISQKTAWFINHKLREIIGSEINSEIKDMGEGGQIVEVDETYTGGKMSNMSKTKRKMIKDGLIEKNANKNTVMGYLERGGNLKLSVLDSRKDVQDNLLNTVSKEALLITDTSPYYPLIGRQFAKHETINHAMNEYKRGHVHTNGVEGAFSLLDRAVIGTFHFVSPKHLQRYCDEIALRYNNKKKTNIDLFMQVVKNSNAPRITYLQLTK